MKIFRFNIEFSNNREIYCVLPIIRKEHELMSDPGFAVQDLCAIKGIYLNRPKQKDCDQFLENEVQKTLI